MIAPPTLEDLTHLAVSGLVDSLNEVWREGTDLVFCGAGVRPVLGPHSLRQQWKAQMYVGLYVEHALLAWKSVFGKTRCRR